MITRPDNVYTTLAIKADGRMTTFPFGTADDAKRSFYRAAIFIFVRLIDRTTSEECVLKLISEQVYSPKTQSVNQQLIMDIVI